MFYFETFYIILNTSSVKNKATLGNASNSKPKVSDARNNSVMQKMLKAKPRPPTLSKSLKVKAGPTAMQKVLKENLRKLIIYKNKPRPAARGRSQNIASKGCKNVYK